MRRPLRQISVALLSVAVSGLALLVAAGPADAVAAPPPVSNVQLTYRSDHKLSISFSVPAAYYDPGAGGVVRLTIGRTPAASPTAGYGQVVTGRTATTRLLEANLTYTFAIWVRDHGLYSRRVTLTTTTKPDVTHPGPANIEKQLVHGKLGANGVAQLDVTWVNPADIDVAGVRIVRNTAPTIAGGKVFWVRAPGQHFLDTGLTPDRRYYYWVIAFDTTDHYSAHYTGTSFVAPSRRITGHVSGYNENVVVDDGVIATGGLFSVDVDGGSFELDVPAGKYRVCGGFGYNTDGSGTPGYCWVRAVDGTWSAAPWDGEPMDAPPAQIDLTTAKTFGDIQF